MIQEKISTVPLKYTFPKVLSECRSPTLLKINRKGYKKTHLWVVQKHDAGKPVNPYLSIETIQKILNEIISKKKVPKELLATKLQIGVNDLTNLINGNATYLIPNINLALVKLYCEINFYNNIKQKEQKDEN